MDELNAKMVTSILAVILLAVFIGVFFLEGPHNFISNMYTWFGNTINGSRLVM